MGFIFCPHPRCNGGLFALRGVANSGCLISVSLAGGAWCPYSLAPTRDGILQQSSSPLVAVVVSRVIFDLGVPFNHPLGFPQSALLDPLQPISNHFFPSRASALGDLDPL